MPRVPDTATPFVCTGCSLLCDDVALVPADDTDSQLRGVCDLGRSWIQSRLAGRGDRPRVQGKPVSYADATAAIADSLSGAAMPLICGLTGQSVETVEAALDVARRTGAALDWTSGPSAAAWQDAWQLTGHVSCSIGEISQRADLLVIWGADPVATHPRLLEFFSGDVYVIDSRPTATALSATTHFPWKAARQSGSLRRLREGAAGPAAVDPGLDVTAGDGLAELFERLRKAAWPVFVVDNTFAGTMGAVGVLSLSRLVRDLNRINHCRLLVLDAEPGERGALETGLLHTGAPFAVRFRDGEPVFRGRDGQAEHLLQCGDVDRVLVIGDRLPGRELAEALQASSAEKLCIGTADSHAAVVVPVATWGIGAAGHGYRTDGTSLFVPAIADGNECPTADRVLREVAKRLDRNSPVAGGAGSGPGG